MKCQSLFSGNPEETIFWERLKNISKCCLLEFLPSTLSDNFSVRLCNTMYNLISERHNVVVYHLKVKVSNPLTPTTLRTNSADDKFLIFFLTFSRKQELTNEMSNPVFWEKQENISKCRLLKILPTVLTVHISESELKIRGAGGVCGGGGGGGGGGLPR